MNLYQSLGRWYVQFDWADPVNGYRLAIGRHAEPITDQYAADDTYPAHIECPEAHMGNVISPVGAQSFQHYDEVGGESGWWSQAIKEAHEDSSQAIGAQSSYVIDVTKGPYVPNPVNQHTGD